MRGFFALATIVFFAISPVSSAYAQKVSQDEIGANLSQRGYSVTEYGANTLFVEVANYDVRIDVVGRDGDISYTTWLFEIDGKDISYNVLNKFNNDTKFGRVYIDGDGDVTLQMDRNGAGGASIENIESDFDVFLALIAAFMSHLEAQAIA